MGPSVAQIWITFTLGCFMPSFVIISPVFLQQKFYINFVDIFSLFCIYLPLETSLAHHFIKLEFSLIKKFGWNWPRQKKIIEFRQCVTLFRHHHPLGKKLTLHLNKHKFPSTKDALSKDWLTQWYLKRRWKCQMFIDGETDGQTHGRRTTGDHKSSL